MEGLLKNYIGNLYIGDMYMGSALVAGILFLIITGKQLRVQGKGVNQFWGILALLFGLYLSVIFTLTLSPPISFSSVGQNVNLVPFAFLGTIGENPGHFWGNIVLFVPVGLLHFLLFNKSGRAVGTVPAGMGLSAFIETIQFFGTRATDIDDIILNTLGVFIGYLIGRAILYLFPHFYRQIGVLQIKKGQTKEIKSGKGRFGVLTALIFCSVFLIGYAGNFAGSEHPQELPVRGAFTEPTVLGQAEQLQVDTIAANAYLWNVDANTVIYEKGSGDPIAPASTTKLLTALTVLDYCDADEEVSVGYEVNLIASDASRAWIMPGSRLTVSQLLDALLLPSGNDAAYALAVFTGNKIDGSGTLTAIDAVAVFVQAMNEKAVAIGTENSCFLTPDGYDREGQYTTARDLAVIADAVVNNRLLREITGNSQISDTWLSGQRVTLTNTNELINPNSSYYYANATGLKTGKSEAAGKCLVSSAKINGDLYICVVMGSTEAGRWQDSIDLYEAAGVYSR